MLRSMTAFAAAESVHDFGTLTIEIRSVNQRFLDIVLRLPDELRVLEPELRERIKTHLARGKVEVAVRLRPDPSRRAQRLTLNRPLAQTLIETHRELADMAGAGTERANLVELLRWPELIVEHATDAEPARAAALELFDQALDQLVAGRVREGAALAGMIGARLDEIGAWVTKVRAWLPEIHAHIRARFAQRLSELPTPVEPGRLEQEIALQLQKLDVDEELDRLQAHCLEVERVLDATEPAGRRLDFFLQELNREANTLASKSTDARTSKAAVELKVLIEQMREQVQNVE